MITKYKLVNSSVCNVHVLTYICHAVHVMLYMSEYKLEQSRVEATRAPYYGNT